MFTEEMKEGGPITVTHRDITRYFMTIPEASRLVITAGALAKGGEIFVWAISIFICTLKTKDWSQL